MMNTCLLVTVLCAVCFMDGSAAFARNGFGVRPQTPSRIPACWYRRNEVRFDSCSCGANADYARVEAESLDEPPLFVVDAFAMANERKGIEALRAQGASWYLANYGIPPDRILMQ